jgi:hypothetical protein
VHRQPPGNPPQHQSCYCGQVNQTYKQQKLISCRYSERLTRCGCNRLCSHLAPESNLHTSTEAQDALRIKDDRPWPRRLLTGCQNGLEETRFGGFFVAYSNCIRPTSDCPPAKCWGSSPCVDTKQNKGLPKGKPFFVSVAFPRRPNACV